jgi:hypothetical protein
VPASLLAVSTEGEKRWLERSPELTVQSILNALQKEQHANDVGQPVLRKKLKTLVAEAGYRVLTAGLRSQLVSAFTSAGLHVSPDVSDPAVGQDAFLTISSHPIQPEAFLFQKEVHLERFVEASLGIDCLKNLSLYKHPDGRSGRQFRLGSLIVDLLCREALSPQKWGLVAIELKRDEAPRGTLVQMGEYLLELRKAFPGRPVRGIIISSSEDAIDRKVLGEQDSLPFRVDWLRYHVTLKSVGSTEPAAGAARENAQAASAGR